MLVRTSSFGFVFLMFVLFASGFTSCCFQNKVVFWVVVDFLLFFLERLKVR